MRKLLIVLLLAGCATVPDAGAVEKAVGRAVKLEKATAVRCALGTPTFTEWQAVTVARLAFDTRYGALMSEAQSAWLVDARMDTNAACGK